MRRMAGYASFGLDRCMLKSKGTGFVSVAVEAKLVLGSGRAQLVREKAAMRIVAVAA